LVRQFAKGPKAPITFLMRCQCITTEVLYRLESHENY
jgi:hypothetical protein